MSVFHLATLSDVEWTMSMQVVLMTLVGGLGTMLGPVVGTHAGPGTVGLFWFHDG